MRKGSSAGASGALRGSASSQLALSAFLSHFATLVPAKANLRRLRREQAARAQKHVKLNTRIVDDNRVGFNLIDGHWD